MPPLYAGAEFPVLPRCSGYHWVSLTSETSVFFKNIIACFSYLQKQSSEDLTQQEQKNQSRTSQSTYRRSNNNRKMSFGPLRIDWAGADGGGVLGGCTTIWVNCRKEPRTKAKHRSAVVLQQQIWNTKKKKKKKNPHPFIYLCLSSAR